MYSGQLREHVCVSTETDLDLCADREHVPLPQVDGLGIVAGANSQSRLVAHIDLDAIDSAVHGLRPVTGKSDDILGALVTCLVNSLAVVNRSADQPRDRALGDGVDEQWTLVAVHSGKQLALALGDSAKPFRIPPATAMSVSDATRAL